MKPAKFWALKNPLKIKNYNRGRFNVGFDSS